MKTIDDSNHHRPPVRMGIAWYRKEQWQRLRQSSEDVDDLGETYEEWLAAALDGLKKLAALGVEAEKVDVDVDELLAWCNIQGLPLNGESRSEFAADKIRKKYEEGSRSENNL